MTVSKKIIPSISRVNPSKVSTDGAKMTTSDDEEMAWRYYFDAMIASGPFTIRRGGIRHPRYPLNDQTIEGFSADKVFIDEVPNGEAG